MLLPIHIVAGGLAIILGAIALSVKKGGTIHRRSGILFVYAMVVMGITASILELLKGSAATGVIAPLMTIYLCRYCAYDRPPAVAMDARDQCYGAGLRGRAGVVLTAGGVNAVNSPGLSGGIPLRMIGVMSLILAAVLLLSAIGDARIMRSGMPRGGRRLARHLWRMCFALFIAAGSFFSIRKRVATIFPYPFTAGPMRALPILLLFGAMFYWLWKVRSRRKLPVAVTQGAG